MINFQQLHAYITRQYRAGSSMLLIAVFATFIVGTKGDDVLTDAGTKRDYLYADDGNDVVVYTPSLNQAHWDHYDGGRGLDTIWFRMSKSEYEHPMFMSDMIRFHLFVIQSGNLHFTSDKGPIFEFSSFHLKLRNVENVIIERINYRDSEPAIIKPAKYHNIRDSSLDSLA